MLPIKPHHHRWVAILVIAIVVALVIDLYAIKMSRNNFQPFSYTAQQMLMKQPFTIISFTDATGTHDVSAKQYEIGFDAQKISGIICNSFNGLYGLGDDNRLSAEKIASTKKMCADDVMSVEDAFLSHLTTGMTFAFEGDKVTITSKDGLTFVLQAKK